MVNTEDERVATTMRAVLKGVMERVRDSSRLVGMVKE